MSTPTVFTWRAAELDEEGKDSLSAYLSLVENFAPFMVSGVTASLQTSDKEKEVDLESVESVTFDSENDVASADNKALLDLKSQRITASAQLISNQTLLDKRQEELVEQERKTASARVEFETAQTSYFASMESKDTSEAQVAYQSAQSELSSSRQYLENAKSAFEQAQTSGLPLLSQKSQIESDLDHAREELDRKQIGHGSCQNRYVPGTGRSAARTNKFSGCANRIDDGTIRTFYRLSGTCKRVFRTRKCGSRINFCGSATGKRRSAIKKRGGQL